MSRRFLTEAVLILAMATAAVSTGATRAQDNATSARPRFYQNWINTEVVYIASPEEKADFARLTSDVERDNFIEEFWQRRNTNPASSYNYFRVEHERRLQFANANFTTGDTPGWKTDRGHIYILWGRPDKLVDSDPAPKPKPGKPMAVPFEVWVYNCLPGVGQDVVVKFIDPCHCGDFQLDSDAQNKKGLLAPPPPNGQRTGCGGSNQPQL